MTFRIDGKGTPPLISNPAEIPETNLGEIFRHAIYRETIGRQEREEHLNFEQMILRCALKNVNEEKEELSLLIDLVRKGQFNKISKERFAFLAKEVLAEVQIECREKIENFRKKQIFFSQLKQNIEDIKHFLCPIFQNYEREIKNKKNPSSLKFSREEREVLEKKCENLALFLRAEHDHSEDELEDLFPFYDSIRWGIRDQISLELQFNFLELKLTLREINHFIYLERVRNILEENKEGIVKALFPDLAASTSRETFTLFPVASETHNRGQIPCRVLQSSGGQERYFYYKPRSAEMDISIIELFKALNKLSIGDPKKELPVYTILTLPKRMGSVWEFIKGNHHPLCLQQAVKVEPDLHKQKKMGACLERLESVCKAAGIVDLHSDNLLINEEGKVTPIDLECLSVPGSDTSLYQTNPPPVNLTQAEMQLIESFRINASTLPNRIVPIATATWNRRMLHLGEIQEIVLNPQNHFQELTNQNFLFLNENLCKSLIKDYVHGDIPYFLKLKNRIYLGEVKMENWIASQR